MSEGRQRQHEMKDETADIGARRRKSEFPVIVVGIGAAAGALKSLKQLFAKMPSGHGVAFVIIPHPAAPSENLTIKELGNLTALPVVEATDGMPILADRIHVMPPDKFLNINGASLTLHEPLQCDGLWMPIDHFFCSLAADQQRRACGILLSGAGSDGTLGLSEVKAAGGRTLVEDPQGAEFPQMPQSAIDVGVADAVLPAEAMAEAVLSFAGRMIADTRKETGDSPEFDSYLRDVLDILRAKVGHDFRCYKPNTLVRRIRRRMALGKISTFADYARFLRENPDEVGLLRKDLLIGVTEFFRQPQAWEVLEQKVIAPLMANAGAGSDKRIWVPGCSTGQEVYTLAMLLAEHMEKSGEKKNLQIFATDSDFAALAVARSGRYSKDEIGENVSPDRLMRFFERKDSFYQVVKMIREQVVFAPQNITADPPFSRMDLISCRNLLIYLDQAVQKKIIDLFHFALREGGFLFLGTAETVGGRDDLFAPVSKKWRIYRRIGVGRPVGVEIPVRPAGESMPMPEKLTLPPPPSRVSLASMAQQMLRNRFAPACVMIDRKLQVVYVHGAVEEYLTFPPGELTTRIVEMAREGLRVRLRGGIAKCLEINRSVSVTARVRRGQKSIPVKAIVSPLRYPREGDGLLLITFEDSQEFKVKSRRGTAGESEVHQLEDELKVAREELQSTIEQLEASNDQLKASNEEAMAANEELQSANEEMETSKEELQSLNEELNTINARLQEKVEEMENTNNDIVNLLSSTNIATVFLDKELRVRRYTPASTRLLSLIPSDAGRPIADVLRRFNDGALLDDARRVLADLTPLAKEVRAEDGGWFIRRITPYRTQDDRIEGVVVTFVDVCDLKSTEEGLRRHQADLETARAEAENARRRLAVVVDSIADGFFAFDRDWQVTHVNEAALRHYRKTREEMVGRGLFEVLPAARGTIFETEYRRSMERGEPVHFEAPSVISDRIMEIHAYPGPDNITVLFRDITERHRMAAALQEAHERAKWLARFPEENPNPVMRVATDGTILYCNPASARIPGWECMIGECLQQPLLSLVGRAMAEGAEAEQTLELGGKFYYVWVTPFPGEDYANVYARDVTESKRAEEGIRQRTLELQQLTETLEQRVQERTAELSKSNEQLQAEMAARLRLVAAVEQAGEGVAIMNPEGLIEYVNPAFERIRGVGWQEIRGKKYEEFLEDEGGQQEFWSGMVRKKTWSGHVIRKAGGQSLELDITFSPIRDGSGAVINYLAVERNVTQEVRLEQHLRQMQKMEALGTLAGGIAHDFNNILNPIFINTELVLLDASPGSPLRQPLQMVLEAAERGKKLVKQIITFSRQKEQEAKPLKVEPLIKEALKFLRASLPSTVEIREKIQKETGFILSDPTQIYQVVMNLCSNAAYAMREQGGVLDVSLAEVDVDADMAERLPDLSPGPYLRLTVADTGVGMTKEVQERAFDPFFTTKKPSEGSGMGLSVVHGIVRNSRGAISISSEVGKGSTFNIFFPRVKAEESSPKVSPEPLAMGRERILLVDDEEVQVQSVRNMLERLGYKVVALTDSVEALSLFRKDPRAFDLVITDQTMPQLTGLRLAEELLRVRPDLPIILCTGFSETVDADSAQALGVRQFLMKPFSLTDMAETIRRALEKK